MARFPRNTTQRAAAAATSTPANELEDEELLEAPGKVLESSVGKLGVAPGETVPLHVCNQIAARAAQDDQAKKARVQALLEEAGLADRKATP